MDAIIKAVREELRKQQDNTKKEEVKGLEHSGKTSGPAKGTERTVNRLSGLLHPIRNQSGQITSVAAGANRNKKPRIDKRASFTNTVDALRQGKGQIRSCSKQIIHSSSLLYN